MPEIHITASDLAKAAFDGLKWFFTLPSGGYPSEYPKHPERIVEPQDGEPYQPTLPFGFDSEGTYINPAEY